MNKTVSKVFIAADHRGAGLKLYLIEMLSAAGYNVVNLGSLLLSESTIPLKNGNIHLTMAKAGLQQESRLRVRTVMRSSIQMSLSRRLI